MRVERQLSRLIFRALVALVLAAWLVFGFMGVQWVQELPVYLILVAGLFTLLQEATRHG